MTKATGGIKILMKKKIPISREGFLNWPKHLRDQGKVPRTKWVSLPGAHFLPASCNTSEKLARWIWENFEEGHWAILSWKIHRRKSNDNIHYKGKMGLTKTLFEAIISKRGNSYNATVIQAKGISHYYFWHKYSRSGKYQKYNRPRV